MTAALTHVLEAMISTLAESRVLPKRILAGRARKRIAFLHRMHAAGAIGAEIGVQKGFFSHVLLQHIRPERLHLIDAWYVLGDEWPWASGNKSTCKALVNVIRWFACELASDRVVLHIGFDEPVLQSPPDACFDWIYLDTSHEKAHARREMDLLGIKVKPGGWILGDDWFDDPSHPFCGQANAIREFCAKHDYELTYTGDVDHQWALHLPPTAGRTGGMAGAAAA